MLFPIGIFDSGYGGLTVLKRIRERLPDYDFLYLGDNARAPYGSKSFDEIYQHTRESVSYLFSQGCPLVILACNTASARALRTIQQQDLLSLQREEFQRVLGVIRPTAESIKSYTQTQHIGILGTAGTIGSLSYPVEINKFCPDVVVHQQACPTWVSYIEQGKQDSCQAKQQIQKDLKELLSQNELIDCVLLACTHYPLVRKELKEILPQKIQLLGQGEIVAHQTADYLGRHPEVDRHCARNGQVKFMTTGRCADFQHHARRFYGEEIIVEKILL